MPTLGLINLPTLLAASHPCTKTIGGSIISCSSLFICSGSQETSGIDKATVASHMKEYPCVRIYLVHSREKFSLNHMLHMSRYTELIKSELQSLSSGSCVAGTTRRYGHGKAPAVVSENWRRRTHASLAQFSGNLFASRCIVGDLNHLLRSLIRQGTHSLPQLHQRSHHVESTVDLVVNAIQSTLTVSFTMATNSIGNFSG